MYINKEQNQSFFAYNDSEYTECNSCSAEENNSLFSSLSLLFFLCLGVLGCRTIYYLYNLRVTQHQDEEHEHYKNLMRTTTMNGAMTL